MTHAVEDVGYFVVQRLLIFRETRDDTTHGGGVEEGYGRPQYAIQGCLEYTQTGDETTDTA